MKIRSTRRILFAGAAIALLAACNDSSISSPGEGSLGASPPPPPPPPSGPTLSLVPAAGCPTGSSRSASVVSGVSVDACRISGDIAADMTIPSGVTVVISGPVFVGTDTGPASSGGITTAAPATLTLGAGARIVGASGSDFLVVPRGSKIIAEGTASQPIIMTSMADLIATNSGTPRNGTENNSSEWGGLVINGRAPINACADAGATGGTTACQKSGEGGSGNFGGANPADNSGVLKYLQVRYAGFRVNNENELNGIAFQGVGNATQVDYIQVHNNSDDGVEFFGGTVNAKHIVLTGNEDDSLDWTDGWTGKVQYVVVRHRAGAGLGDNGFEMDNREGSHDRLPRSNPTVSNFTLVGANTSARGLLYRAGTSGRLLNGIVTGFPTCLDIDDSSTYANAGTFASLHFSCPTAFDGDADNEAAVFNAGANNVIGDSSLTNLFPGANELAVPATNPNDSFFDVTSYIGAFGPTETPTSNWASGWTFGLFNTNPPCPSGTTEVAGGALQGRKTCRLPANVSSDLTLVGGNNYELSGPVFVGRDAGGNPAAPLPTALSVTLTVEAGAVVYGASGSDYLVVTRGSKLRSLGNRAQPVIWTSRTDLLGTVGINERGSWGGLVINGRAPINHCSTSGVAGGSADCNKSGEGSSGLFGGNAPTDDSGSIFYTRVQYAGFRVTPENELNGIAFQGVGNGTDVDYVHVHNTADDGVEFFGGTVNAKHLVLTGNDDDSLDWTDGWIGKVQYVIVQHTNIADSGFEMDNREGNHDFQPRSKPIISNFTAIGRPTSGRGLLYRAGTSGDLINGIVADFNTCLDIRDTSTYTNAGRFAGLYFSCNNAFDPDADNEASVAGSGVTSGPTTLSGTTANRTSLVTGTRGVVPGANELAVTPVNPGDPFFDVTTYIGAVRDANDDWYKGWTLVQQ